MLNHDYTYYALESCLSDQKILHETQLARMSNELQFMQSCLECGMVLPLMEATATNSFIGRIKVTIKKFFDAVVSLFRNAQKDRMSKYGPVIKKFKNEIINNAANHTFEVLPFWKGNPDKDYRKIETMINNAFNNMRNNKVGDFGFVKDFIDPKNIGNTNAVDMLKNYFRIGVENSVEIKTEVIKSDKLTQIAGDMVEYIIVKSDNIVDSVTSLKNSLDSRIDKLTPPTTTKIQVGDEQPTQDGYFPSLDYQFIIEGGRTIDKTDIATLLNYSAIYEADEDRNQNRSGAFQNAANKGDDKKTQVKDSNGEKTSTTSIKSVDSTEDDNTGKKTNTKVESSKDPEFETYVTECIRIIKLVISAFMTACDERYLVYGNICLKILKSKYILKKDDKGFYYVDGDKAENSTTQVVQQTNEKNNEPADNKPKQRARSAIFNRGKK